MNSIIRVTLSCSSPMVTGNFTVPAARTHSPANPYRGVCVGVSTTPSIFSLANASINMMSAELPLSIRTRLTRLSATRTSPVNASLWGCSRRSASSSVKVIGVELWRHILETCSAMFMNSPREYRRASRA